jgi:hypothetical protein
MAQARGKWSLMDITFCHWEGEAGTGRLTQATIPGDL